MVRVYQSMRLPQSRQWAGRAAHSSLLGLSAATRRARERWCGRVGLPSHRRSCQAVMEHMTVKVTVGAPT